jgi:methionyl-tRNA formyltransferase
MQLKKNIYLANKTVCVLGSYDDIYTKMVVKYLEEYKISYDLVLVKANGHKMQIPRLIHIINLLFNLLYSGNFIALSKSSFYTYLLVWRMLKYKRSRNYKSLVKPFVDINLKKHAKYIVNDVNHVALYKFLEKEKYDIGLFAGVGIVHAEIIGLFAKFCLNAHPAPLPECRGGGAIQFTLHKGLQPAASVHYATSEIDSGSILLVSEIEVLESDTINSLSDRVTIHAAEKLVEVTLLILSGKKMIELQNFGKLNYWKHCTKDIQMSADAALLKLKRIKNQTICRWPN